MARSLDPGFVADPDDARWPPDAGWPYPDDDELVGDLHDPADPAAESDDEILSLQGLGPRLLDGLNHLERTVVAARFGLDGQPARTMKALQAELGMPRSELRPILGDALQKVRNQLG
jgi:DNA-directed RNA polymerase sigma subunit (sigma70/sigma32)